MFCLIDVLSSTFCMCTDDISIGVAYSNDIVICVVVDKVILC
jgi:hypothetical protein